jgi:glycosyltransferase involved in cell wall biosynthesis
VRFTVAGYGSGESLVSDLSDSRCALLESPSDLTPLYADAAVVVAPVRTGGGTRIKVLEALARGRALVSTSFAAEGLGLGGGVHLELADTAAEFAAACVRLLSDQKRRMGLATAGRAYVAERFDWRNIECRLPELVSRLS